MTVFELVRRKIGISTKLLNALKQKEDGILVNGKRVTVRYILSHGDILQLNTAVDTKPSENIPPTPLPLEIIYEDLDIILLNKPYAMPTHPSRGHFTDTLANALAYY